MPQATWIFTRCLKGGEEEEEEVEKEEEEEEEQVGKRKYVGVQIDKIE